MTEKKQTGTDKAVLALYDFLSNFYSDNRRLWLHGFNDSEFEQGRDIALTELALIPELRSALDAIDKENGREDQQLGSELEHWNGQFKSKRESEAKEGE
jgi:hypothetical protein